jgi:hypothetical protein
MPLWYEEYCETKHGKKNRHKNISLNSKMALEGGSRKRAFYSEILEKRWRHKWQARPQRRGKILTLPHLQPEQRISTSH